MADTEVEFSQNDAEAFLFRIHCDLAALEALQQRLVLEAAHWTEFAGLLGDISTQTDENDPESLVLSQISLGCGVYAEGGLSCGPVMVQLVPGHYIELPRPAAAEFAKQEIDRRSATLERLAAKIAEVQSFITTSRDVAAAIIDNDQ